MNETAICPHCDKPGIVILSRSWFSRGWPATCRECGALSYDQPHGIITFIVFGFEALGAPLLLFAFFTFPRMVRPLVIAAVVLFFIYWWCRRGGSSQRTRFQAISPESSQRSRYLTYFAIFIAVAVCIAIAVHRR